MSSEDTPTQARSAGPDGRYPAFVGRLLGVLPEPVRSRLLRHREVLKFLIVGGTCFVVTVAINYTLKLTVLSHKPVTALTIATILATMLSYVLNREWSFRTRGGRVRHHEAALFFTISGIAVAINSAPMWVARYLFNIQVPDVSRFVQEASDFLSGIVLGTLLAMLFRLWAFRKFVFPQAGARTPRPVRPGTPNPTAPDPADGELPEAVPGTADPAAGAPPEPLDGARPAGAADPAGTARGEVAQRVA